jgi:hypothetical protein
VNELCKRSNIATIKSDFWNTLNNRGKISLNLLNDKDIQEIAHPNGKLLAIHVPRATRHQGPIFIGQNPLSVIPQAMSTLLKKDLCSLKFLDLLFSKIDI